MGGNGIDGEEPGQGSCFEVPYRPENCAEDKRSLLASQSEKKSRMSIVCKECVFCVQRIIELNAEILKRIVMIEGAECQSVRMVKKVLEAFEQSVPGDYEMIFMDADAGHEWLVSNDGNPQKFT